MNPSHLSPQRFQTYLLKWFDQHGRKHLPWQQNKTPYRVWISEIMLQQTQVNTVIPYFERFMHIFPDVFALAQASLDQVLHIWAGLGYYSRARFLHCAAKRIVEDHDGYFPNTQAGLLTLPGIGPSTAGAILSLAFNQPAAILDGNVKRVLTRFHGITSPINEKSIENQLWELASYFTPHKRPADYTQAMMDLGAMVCLRNQPICHVCPLHRDCIAHKENLAAFLPIKKSTKKLAIHQATFFVFKKNQHVLLYKRPLSGIWGGLWSLPQSPGQANKKALRAFCKKQFQLNVSCYQGLKPFRHSFTHYHLEIFPVLIPLTSFIRCVEEDLYVWYDLSNPQPLGLPKPIERIMRELR